MTVILHEANYKTYRLQPIINSTFMDKIHTRLKYSLQFIIPYFSNHIPHNPRLFINNNNNNNNSL